MTSELPGGYPEQSQATTVLVLGILSIVLCQILGPIAWKMGNDELKAIADQRRPADGQAMAQAGKICGIVGTALLGVAVLFIIGFFLLLTLGIITSAEMGRF
ncbi:MAG TPA: DUF4190 domain-containing protein [Acidimicrobiia bacterium]|nr:DUF4190 domain-containing protein [Acidimicrobiia bacterium]